MCEREREGGRKGGRRIEVRESVSILSLFNFFLQLLLRRAVCHTLTKNIVLEPISV